MISFDLGADADLSAFNSTGHKTVCAREEGKRETKRIGLERYSAAERYWYN